MLGIKIRERRSQKDRGIEKHMGNKRVEGRRVEETVTVRLYEIEINKKNRNKDEGKKKEGQRTKLPWKPVKKKNGKNMRREKCREINR